jgi:hypothetical protein
MPPFGLVRMARPTAIDRTRGLPLAHGACGFMDDDPLTFRLKSQI